VKRRSSDAPASHRLTVRLTPPEVARLAELARLRGTSPSEVLRSVLAELPGGGARLQAELHDDVAGAVEPRLEVARPGPEAGLHDDVAEAGARGPLEVADVAQEHDDVDHAAASLEAPPVHRSALAAALARLAAPRGIP